jgi:hypothetical protein
MITIWRWCGVKGGGRTPLALSAVTHVLLIPRLGFNLRIAAAVPLWWGVSAAAVLTSHQRFASIPFALYQVVRVPGYRSRGPDSIPGATRFSDKYWVWNGIHSASWVQLRSYLEEKVAALVQKTENTAVGIRCPDHATPSIHKNWHWLRWQAAGARSL